MKIKLTITEWSGWNGGSKKSEEKLLPINFLKRRYTFKGRHGLAFGFKVKKINKENVIIQVFGDAGTKRDPKTHKYVNYPKFTLELNTQKEFATHTFDWGLIYTLELVK
jgi:hypothetical protein